MIEPWSIAAASFAGFLAAVWFWRDAERQNKWLWSKLLECESRITELTSDPESLQK